MTYFHHLGLIADEFPLSALPRSPRPLILDLLTTWGPERWMPTSALIALAAEFSVTEATTRTALSRLVRRGLLESRREGRTSSCRLAPDTAREMVRMNTDVLLFGASEREWDGEWTVVVFTLDEDTRHRAHTVRGQLRWLGFGPLRDGVWVSPHADLERTRTFLTDLLDNQSVLLRGPVLQGDIDLRLVWPIDEIAREYDRFVNRCQNTRYRLRGGSLSDHEALIERIELLGEWRRFPTIDPDLPTRMLPLTWPRVHARGVFVDILGPLEEIAHRRITRHVEARGGR